MPTDTTDTLASMSRHDPHVTGRSDLVDLGPRSRDQLRGTVRRADDGVAVEGRNRDVELRRDGPGPPGVETALRARPYAACARRCDPGPSASRSAVGGPPGASSDT